MFYYEEILSEIRETIIVREGKWLMENNWIINEVTKLIHKLNFLVRIKNLLEQQTIKQVEKINSLSEAIKSMEIELDKYRQKLMP